MDSKEIKVISLQAQIEAAKANLLCLEHGKCWDCIYTQDEYICQAEAIDRCAQELVKLAAAESEEE